MSGNFWETIPEKFRKELKSLGISRSYEKGSIVFSEGDGFHGFYVVEKGKFKI